MVKMKVTFVIGPDGQVKADVVNGQGYKCITEVLGPLEELLGQAERTDYKPEYELDYEALRFIESQKVHS